MFKLRVTGSPPRNEKATSQSTLELGVSYVFSVVGTFLPGIFPASFRGEDGEVAVYFEAAAAITTLVLLGQVMELRARSQTVPRSELF